MASGILNSFLGNNVRRTSALNVTCSVYREANQEENRHVFRRRRSCTLAISSCDWRPVLGNRGRLAQHEATNGDPRSTPRDRLDQSSSEPSGSECHNYGERIWQPNTIQG